MTFMKLGALSLAVCMGMGMTATTALASTEVKLGYALAPTSHYGVAADKLKDVVEAETNGEFTFSMYPSSGLGGEREVIEGLQLGTVEATIVSSGTLANFVPETGVFDIPFLFRDLGHARRVLDGPIGQEILTKFTDQGLVALAWGEQGFRHVTNNRNQIAEPKDMAGMKLRTMENPVHIEAFETLGAAPTPMAWPEVISALQQGTIDGQENPLSVITSAKLYEVQKYLTLTGHVYSPAMILVSKIFWDGLSDDQKAAFAKGAKEASTAMRAFVSDVETKGVEQLKAAGMEVGTLTPEARAEFQKALAPAYAHYAETYGQPLIDAIIATQ
ncbi:TRAP transporter substrate-binding protein [Rhodospirillum sp. A1_3_36]|uniref:TRAP transporter substrate-binding protein n=1 Tax=Rhodospirillum sp. A1_3_36 TaxID=3391666 RepID=UPI0039A4245E